MDLASFSCGLHEASFLFEAAFLGFPFRRLVPEKCSNSALTWHSVRVLNHVAGGTNTAPGEGAMYRPAAGEFAFHSIVLSSAIVQWVMEFLVHQLVDSNGFGLGKNTHKIVQSVAIQTFKPFVSLCQLLRHAVCR